MSQKVRLLDVFEGRRYLKIVLVVSVLAFLVLELLIYLGAASQAGTKSRTVVLDSEGNKVFETAGSALSSYEKLVFENNHGPIQNFRMQLQTETLSFPFRAWLSAAVGIPIGLILLVSFLVKVYLALLYGEEPEKPDLSADGAGVRDRIGSIYQSFHRFNVFHLGFLVLMSVLMFWVVPNFLQDFAKVSLAAIRDYKWFFAGASIFLAVIITWIIYLRYRLSKQMLENQFNIEKFRIETQLLARTEPAPLLPSPVKEVEEAATEGPAPV
ncbi:MAG: hypothetical protein MUF52_04155 [Syntrophobacteraceae bacterium]|jgi:hypothetical protein|nr:hypothetical protein [Syntrophobacteraceae bacterium]